MWLYYKVDVSSHSELLGVSSVTKSAAAPSHPASQKLFPPAHTKRSTLQSVSKLHGPPPPIPAVRPKKTLTAKRMMLHCNVCVYTGMHIYVHVHVYT